MTKFEDLTIEMIEILSQAHTRLMAEGFIPHFIKFGDFLDCVTARGEYSNTSTDYIFSEEL